MRARSGSGQIRSLGQDRFLVRISAGVDAATGKRRQPSRVVRGTRQDADTQGRVSRLDFREHMPRNAVSVAGTIGCTSFKNINLIANLSAEYLGIRKVRGCRDHRSGM